MVEAAAALQERDVHRDPAGRWIVRPYQPGDEVRILDLFRRVFNVERSLDHWRWKFLDNPAGRHWIRLAETPSRELVGHYAVLPVRMAWGEETAVFIQVVDVMVDPSFRRGLRRPGLFSVLANRSIADFGGPGKASVGYGFPTPEALRIGGRVAGYTPLHPVVRLVRDLRQGERRRPAWSDRGVRIEEVDRYGEAIDRLWERMRSELGVAAVRDTRYLNWRYADCPDVRYRMLAAFNRLTGAPAGMAVLRLGVRGERLAALVDWLVPGRTTTTTAGALLRRCEAAAREAAMDRLDAWFPPYSMPHHLFLEFGFRTDATIYELVALPLSAGVSLDGLKERWYYTMGDSDIY